MKVLETSDSLQLNTKDSHSINKQMNYTNGFTEVTHQVIYC